MTKKLISQKEVAEILGVTEAWLEKMRYNGGGIPYCKIGRAVRYQISEVYAYIDANVRR